MLFLKVIAESLSEEEIAGLKEMFKMIDTDNSGQITLEELKNGLERVGANLKDSEIINLMQAVSSTFKIKSFKFGKISLLIIISAIFQHVISLVSCSGRVLTPVFQGIN